MAAKAKENRAFLDGRKRSTKGSDCRGIASEDPGFDCCQRPPWLGFSYADFTRSGRQLFDGRFLLDQREWTRPPLNDIAAIHTHLLPIVLSRPLLLPKGGALQRFKFGTYPEERRDFLPLATAMPKAGGNDLAKLEGLDEFALGIVPNNCYAVVIRRCGITECDQ